MARKIECNDCGLMHSAGSPCRCAKYKYKDSIELKIAKKFYDIGCDDGGIGIAFYKNDDDIKEILKILKDRFK